MLPIETTNLPQDQQQLLHPDFLADEQAYLQMRDRLLTQYPGQWVAVHGGKVIAAGPKLMEVMERAAACGGHPYIALVGAEDAVVFRVRRGVFAYDRPFLQAKSESSAATYSTSNGCFSMGPAGR
jgi:hypothetical protein